VHVAFHEVGHRRQEDGGEDVSVGNEDLQVHAVRHGELVKDVDARRKKLIPAAASRDSTAGGHFAPAFALSLPLSLSSSIGTTRRSISSLPLSISLSLSRFVGTKTHSPPSLSLSMERAASLSIYGTAGVLVISGGPPATKRACRAHMENSCLPRFFAYRVSQA